MLKQLAYILHHLLLIMLQVLCVIILLWLILSFGEATAKADNFKVYKKPRPHLHVIEARNNSFESSVGVMGTESDVKETIKLSRRYFKNIFSKKIRIKHKSIYGVPFAGCSNIDSNPSTCLWNFLQYLNRNGFSRDKGQIYHLIHPGMPYNGRVYFGGAAFPGCYKEIYYKGSRRGVEGLSYSHHVKTQTNGQNRIPGQVALIIHEAGHSVFKLSHDGEDDEFIMSTNFNSLGISDRVPPQLWRASPKSFREIAYCKGVRR